MKYKVARVAEPHLTLLLVATVLSIGLWLIGAIVVRAQPNDPINWRFAAAAFLGSTLIALFNANLVDRGRTREIRKYRGGRECHSVG